MACIAMSCNKGNVRKVNQDACCVMEAKSSLGEIVMLVVCDGVGGLSRGELASSAVVNGFTQWFEQDLPQVLCHMQNGFDPTLVQRGWEQLLASLNETIREDGLRGDALMGTTFTGLLLCGQTFVVGHVGDCRAYVVRGDAIRQVTEDQTLLERMRAEGADGARVSQERLQSVILQAVGTERVLKPAFYMGRGVPGDVYVLCSDGAYKTVGTEGIRGAFAHVDPADEQSLRAVCEQVIELDIRSGETDNRTIVCASLASPLVTLEGGEQK